LMLPKNCVNFLLLKSCVIHETTKTLRYITTKYNVKRSTYGWYFLQELSAMMKSLYSKANAQTWEQWANFKSYYYANLFSVMYTYKKLFQVSDMDSVDDLETGLGSILDNNKRDGRLKPEDFGLLDTLDKEMYDEFLSIKADYNNYAPIEKDPTVLNYLKVRLHRFLDNFVSEHNSQHDSELSTVVRQVRDSLDKWIQEAPNKPESVVAISTMNVHPEMQKIDFGSAPQKSNLDVPTNENQEVVNQLENEPKMENASPQENNLQQPIGMSEKANLMDRPQEVDEPKTPIVEEESEKPNDSSLNESEVQDESIQSNPELASESMDENISQSEEQKETEPQEEDVSLNEEDKDAHEEEVSQNEEEEEHTTSEEDRDVHNDEEEERRKKQMKQI